MKTITGIEQIQKKIPKSLINKSLGLLANPASVNSKLMHSKDIINNLLPGQLKALFSPQHGFNAEKQDNMIFSDDTKDTNLNLPVYSLYGPSLKPKKEMFKEIDTLIIDIQDVGTRVYTFIYTISYCLEAARENNIKVVILDRPNPVSGLQIEGNILEQEFASFVGRYPIPMRHGLTVGEFALFINTEFNINADLEIIKMDSWQRQMYFSDTNLPWILPSPNLPTKDSAYVYPGQVIIEGTNLSEGRGTTKPFEFFGAPYLNCCKFKKFIQQYKLKGIYLRETAFEPTSGKWAKTPCFGFQLHITDEKEFKPYFTSLVFFQAASILFKEFQLKQPPYEFEHEKMPMDLILGSKKLRLEIQEGKNISELEEKWLNDLEAYKNQIKDYLLY